MTRARHVHLAEDHCDSFLIWKDLGLRGCTALHVDAHFDCSNDILGENTLRRILGCDSGREVGRLREEGALPWGGLHGGNYLYPAMREGIVSRLVWILPEGLARRGVEAFFQAELRRSLDMTLQDFRSFAFREGRVEGELWGVPVTVATPSAMPRLEGERLLLDIDADFFTSPGDMLADPPENLIEALCRADGCAVVALSTHGGYTPLKFRVIGWILAMMLQGELDEWRRVWEFLQELDGMTAVEPRRALDALDAHFPRDGFPAPYHYWRHRALRYVDTEGAQQELAAAQALDPGYAPDVMSCASYHFLRERYGEAQRLLEVAGERSGIRPLALYMAGLVCVRQGDYRGAASVWRRILEEPLRDDEKALASYRLGETLVRAGEARSAVEFLDGALAMGYELPARAHWQKGLAFELLGDLDGSARELRRSLRVDGASLDTLDVRLALARVYDAQGLENLSRVEYDHLVRDDPGGYYGALARLRGGKAAQRGVLK